MSRIVRLVLLLLFVTQLVWAQDSAETLVQRAQDAEAAQQSKQAAELWQQAADALAQEGNENGAALALFFRGRLLAKMDQLDESEKSLKIASELFSKLQRPDGVALAELQRGNNYLERQDPQTAIKHYEKAWDGAIESQDAGRALECGGYFATCLEGMSRFGRAKDIRNTMLELARSSGNKFVEGETHLSLAAIALLERKPKRAHRNYQAAIRLYETANLKKEATDAKMALGGFHLAQKEYSQAAEVYEGLLESLQDARRLAVTHANLALSLQKIGQPERARTHYLEALKGANPSESHAIHCQIAEILMARTDKAQAHEYIQKNFPTVTWQDWRSRAELYKNLGERELAARDWGQVLKLAPPDKLPYFQNQWAVQLAEWDRVPEGQSLLREVLENPNIPKLLRASASSNMGETHLLQGSYEQAESFFVSAIDLGDDEIKFTARNNLASVYQEQGDFQTAIGIHLENIRTLGLGPQRTEKLATVKNALGLAYVKLGRHEEGIRIYRETLQLRSLANDRRGEITTRLNLAVALENLGKGKDTVREYQTCLELAQDLGDLRLQATLHNNLGRAKMGLAKEEALAHFEESIRLSKRAKDPLSQAITLSNKGESLLDMSQYDEGLATLRRARARLIELGARDNLIATHKLLAQELSRREKNEEALEEFEAAIQLIDEGIRSFVNRSATTYLEKHKTIHRQAQALYLLANKRDRAFEILELSKASAILAMTRGQNLYSHLPPALSSEIASLEKRIATLLNQQRTGRETRTLKNLKRDYGLALERAEAVKYGSSQIALTTSASLKDVQAQLEPKETLVEFFFLKSRLFAFILSSEKSELEFLCKTNDLGPLLDQAKASLANKTSQTYSGLVDKVSAQLWSRLEKHAKPGEHLIFVTEGPLHTFPLGILKGQDGTSLLETYTLEYAASSAVWLASRQRAQKASKTKRGLVAALGAHTPNLSGSFGSNRMRSGALSPLPATLREIDSVGRFLSRPVSLKEERMTSAEIKSEVPQKSVLHFATHGLIDEKFPLLSGLVTADGILTASEILKWNLDADLVVLSACNTGNQSVDGLGLVGLTAAFQHAGTRSIVATLWPVSDDATAVWMDYLYDELAKDKTLAESCAMASRKLKQSKPHPHYWAPFINMGRMSARK